MILNFFSTLLILVLTSQVVSAVNWTQRKNSPECQAFQKTLNRQWQDLNILYRQADVRFQKTQPENSPRLTLKSTDEIVVLLHGYLGSPFEMARMESIALKKGYSVLNDLIPGYGFSARIANQFTSEFWNQYFDQRYSAVMGCFRKVHFVGFSTGGQIIHRFLMDKPNRKAQSVHLISPFYEPTLKFLNGLNQWISVFKSEIPITSLYLTSFGAVELKIMVIYPKYYLTEAPFLNMSQIVKYGSQIQNLSQRFKNRSPVYLYATQKDLVMDFDATMKVLTRDFPALRLVDFSKTTAPHHLFRPEVSAEAVQFEASFMQNLK